MSEKLTIEEIRQVCAEVFADGAAAFDAWLNSQKAEAFDEGVLETGDPCYHYAVEFNPYDPERVAKVRKEQIDRYVRLARECPDKVGVLVVGRGPMPRIELSWDVPYGEVHEVDE